MKLAGNKIDIFPAGADSLTTYTIVHSILLLGQLNLRGHAQDTRNPISAAHNIPCGI